MSTTSLSFHNVTEVNVRIDHANNRGWLDLNFTDRDGEHLEVTIFSDAPEKLLEAIAAVSKEQAKEASDGNR